MAVAALEHNLQTLEFDLSAWENEVNQVPQAIQLSELDVERNIQPRFTRFIGQVATRASLESRGTPPDTSLFDAMQRAKEGNPEARKLIEANVSTDVIERTIKAGHVMRVSLGRNSNGEIMQHGHTASSIQANSLRHAAGSWQMRERTEAEVRNMLRIQTALEFGQLENNVVVVLSRTADTMTTTEMEKVGFFVDTMSIAIQATTLEADGSLTTESAFVAGKKDSETGRNDAWMMAQLTKRLGISADVSGFSAAKLIDMPLLIPKRLMPGGVIDLVQITDVLNGGTFFGQDKPVRDYHDYLQLCLEREKELEPTVQQIVSELINLADAIENQTQATTLLGKLSGAHLIERALHDDSIDLAVFGAASAASISEARHWMSLGEHQLARDFLKDAVSKDKSSSCPGGGGGPAGGESSEDEDCEFESGECPLCHRKNVHTVVKKLAGGKKLIKGACGCSTVA